VSIDKFISKHLSAPKGISGRLVSFFMNRQNRAMYDETIRLLSLDNKESVLDIGCGNGYVMNMIAKQYDCILTGIDISDSIVKAAVHRNRQFVKAGKMAFHCQNTSAMAFDNESFSRVYSINTVYFWDNLIVVMEEINRILKPNGFFVNTLFSNETLDSLSHTKFGYKRFTADELTEAAINAGFTVDKVPILNGKAYCFIHKKPSCREGDTR
jgi:ubiquinone/menaquinone biosynthesis C-methylase UbiE